MESKDTILDLKNRGTKPKILGDQGNKLIGERTKPKILREQGEQELLNLFCYIFTINTIIAINGEQGEQGEQEFYRTCSP